MTSPFYSILLILMLGMMCIIINLMIIFLHPVIVMLMVISFCFLLCLSMSPWMVSYLMSILLFMIMISGLLIIFLYFSSILANEKLKTPLPLKIKITIIFLICSWYLNYKYQMFSCGDPATDFKLFIFNQHQKHLLLNMYTHSLSWLTLISMIYLLIALILIIKISTPKAKTLRKIM